MTQYKELVGGYSECVGAMLREGGQVYSSEQKGGANVHVRGCYVNTYWEKDSKQKGKVLEACELFGYDSYAMTGGRLIRRIIADIVQLNYQKTRYAKCYEELAKDGGHWHYQFVNPGDNGYCVEFDLKSAYFTSYLQLDSCLLKDANDFLEDGGAMERLRELNKLFPKWMRLQFLGVLASHSKSTITRKQGKEGWEVKLNKFPSIETGYAFNAAHRAILRTYKIMKKVHQIGGEYIARIHTDSFAIKANCPDSVEAELFNFLKTHNQEIAVKGMGRLFLWDLNTGYIGRKTIGQKQEVLTRIREENIHYDKHENVPELIARWEHIIEGIDRGMDGRKSIPVNWEQLQLNTGYQDCNKEDYDRS